MTQPWFPDPNPGGQHRRLIRTAVANWVIAQHIQGVDHVYRSVPPEWQFDAYPHTGVGYGAMVGVSLPDDSEDRLAYTGPTDPGGKLVHYTVDLTLIHWSYTTDDAQDSEASEDDYDRIYDALKDCFRGIGRDLGRPDVVLMAGEHPRTGGLSGRHSALVDNKGSIFRSATLTLTVSQYLTAYP